MGVEGMAWLGVVCMSVFYGVYFGCSAYIRRLFVISESSVYVRLKQGSGY
jgi:hypothetical protein